jgi:hypothetical protein
VNFNVNLFGSPPTNPTLPGASTDAGMGLSPGLGVIPCPSCAGEIVLSDTNTEWQTCPYCGTRLQIRVWPVVRRNNNAAPALSDQATCFFHPEKAFQACCQRCGRFVCALCDLQLGAEHVCPACFERGRGEGAEVAKAEWRYRDVLYDSIAVTVGWAWILVWPTIVAAIPTAIFLHVKYRKAPRSYLIPRSGWRFWVAYAGFVWLPLLIAIPFSVRWMAGRH